MRRDEVRVLGNREVHCLQEDIDRGLRDSNEGSRVLHSAGVFLGPEDANLAILLAESLEALITVLA